MKYSIQTDSTATNNSEQRTLIKSSELLIKAGNQHRYQFRLIFLLCIQRVSIGFLFMAFNFLFKQPEFQCKSSEEGESFKCVPTKETCQYEIEPIPGSDNSLITYFELYCSDVDHVNIAKNMFTAACSIGVLILFPLADKFGRKPSMVGSYLLGATSLVLAPFATNWWQFASLLAISGLGLSPYLTNSFLMLNEVSSGSMRAFASVIVNCFWTLGQVLAGVLSYWLKNDWQHLVLYGLGIPLIVSTPLILCWVQESPTFLVSKRKFTKANRALKSIAKTNKQDISDFDLYEEKKSKLKKSEGKKKKTYTFFDLCRYRSLRFTTFCASLLCFTIYFNYYGTIFSLSSVQVEPHLLTIVLATAELISYLVSGIMTQCLSRRASFATCSLVCCLSNFMFVLFPVAEEYEGIHPNAYVQLALATLNRFSVSIMMALSGIYITELYPTPVRALGSGLTIFIARLGSFAATMLISLCLKIQLSPMILFGASCIPAILISFVSKETKGLPLPETIEEEEDEDMLDSSIATSAVPTPLVNKSKKGINHELEEVSMSENDDHRNIDGGKVRPGYIIRDDVFSMDHEI